MRRKITKTTGPRLTDSKELSLDTVWSEFHVNLMLLKITKTREMEGIDIKGDVVRKSGYGFHVNLMLLRLIRTIEIRPAVTGS